MELLVDHNRQELAALQGQIALQPQDRIGFGADTWWRVLADIDNFRAFYSLSVYTLSRKRSAVPMFVPAHVTAEFLHKYGHTTFWKGGPPAPPSRARRKKPPQRDQVGVSAGLPSSALPPPSGPTQPPAQPLQDGAASVAQESQEAAAAWEFPLLSSAYYRPTQCPGVVRAVLILHRFLILFTKLLDSMWLRTQGNMLQRKITQEASVCPQAASN